MFAAESGKAAPAHAKGERLHADLERGANESRVVNPLWSKIAMSAPGDAQELEADRVADAVVNDGSVPAITPIPGGETAGLDAVVPAGPGRALAPGTRSLMESRFGAEFAGVRIHTDPDSAQALRAHAYTVGSDIVFGEGRYEPESTAGRALLAHELAHVVQQRGGPGRKVLRQAKVKTRGPTFDEIFDELGSSLGGPYKDYAAYAATMVSGSFLGHPIANGVRPEFLTS